MSDPRLSIIPAGAVFDRRLSPTDLRVLAVLGTHTDKRGWCFPKQKAVAERIGVARTTVTAAIKKLVECGWVKKQQRFRAGGGKTTCLYQVALDQPFEGDCDVMSDDIAMSEETTSQCQPTRPPMSSPDDNNERTHLNETLPIVLREDKTETKRKSAGGVVTLELEMSPRMRAFADKSGFLNGSGEALFERFRAHHASKGSVYVSFDAAFQTWVLNELKFNRERAGRSKDVTHGNAIGHSERRVSAAERHATAARDSIAAWDRVIAEFETGPDEPIVCRVESSVRL